MIRLYAYAAGTIVLLGAVLWAMHAIYAKGDAHGAARIQVQWDANRAAIDHEAARALAEMTTERDQAIQANEGIHRVYETELSSINSSADDLARRLRIAESHLSTGSGQMRKTGDRSGPPAASAPISDARLTSALAAAFAECDANADQLDALVAEINRQL